MNHHNNDDIFLLDEDEVDTISINDINIVSNKSPWYKPKYISRFYHYICKKIYLS